MKLFTISLLLVSSLAFAQPTRQEIARWKKQADATTIIRDQWGIPHIYGKTDANAVFGLLYAQCEDDFNRVEMNYLEKLGRTAEVEGDKAIFNDLYIRLIIVEEEAKDDYAKSPEWLRQLLDAFADGINYYLYTHPEIKPKVLTRFEPWYPLLWTDGSIGAISTGFLNASDVRQFYEAPMKTGMRQDMVSPPYEILDGSNGFAVSGSRTESGHAMLYINPHVTLYFRPEVHMVSEEGLDAYGAVTWGQFFIYQGFNAFNGWMHTSSKADVSDCYLEQIARKGNGYTYLYDGKQLPVKERSITIQYTSPSGKKSQSFRAYATHHGPVMGQRKENWVSVRSNNRSMNGLVQSWQRMKTKGFEDYKQVMNIRANTSNNTVYADNKGNIAYWHGNFMPKRDPNIDWGKAVDGTLRTTEWNGLHSVEETVHIYNPVNGWIQNCNSSPFTVSGEHSPKPELFPKYMAPDIENYRGINAVRVFSEHQEKFDLDKLISAGYDRRLAAFEDLIPALIRSFDLLSPKGGYNKLKEPIDVLRAWDFKTSETSVATTLAIEWGQKLLILMTTTRDEDEYEDMDQIERTRNFVKQTPPEKMLETFENAVADLEQRFGYWRMPWGDVNRYQRLTSDIQHVFSDDKPSIPVGFASSAWGMLPSYASRVFQGTKKRYTFGGNSFICAVEFGDKIKAKSLLAGGVSGDPTSPHFRDQAEMFARGIFKDVLFYQEDVLKHAKETYRPGKRNEEFKK